MFAPLLEKLRRPGPHDAREAHDLTRSFSLHAERDEESGDLRRHSSTVHDLGHGGGGLGFGQVLTAMKLFEQWREHYSSRKFRSMRCPSQVSTDSG